MKQKPTACYFNGKITTLDKVRISPYDIGLLRGYGVFDVMCTANGKPFLLAEHWKRLLRSARELGIRVPLNLGQYQKILAKMLKLNGYAKANIRTVLTGGESGNAFSYQSGRETFFILIEKFQPLPAKIYAQGAQVITLDHYRRFPRAKITNYTAAIRAQREKEKRRALELIYLDQGRALEASTSNFFIIKKGKLVTPKDDILLGMTRNLVIRLARRKMKVEERDVTEKELRQADEVFLTATNKDIVPVVRVDGKKVGDGKIGKNTKMLMRLFADFVKKY